MDLRQLNALLAVAENRSFSAAARALHTVQSNVSTHVARLEREVGVSLIDRARGELTPEGEIVADRARRIRVELQSIEEDLVALREDLTGTVRAGVIGTTARWLVPALLEAVRQHHPRLELIIVEATTTSLAPLIVQRRLDLAVVNLPTEDPDLETRDLFEEDRVLIVPLGHPLADAFGHPFRHPLAEHNRVALPLLAEHELLLPPPGTAFRDEIDADARRARIRLRTRAEVDGLRLLASLAFSGFAPALLPASAAWGQEGSWRTIPVDGLSRRRVGLARSRRTTPSAPARGVMDLIRDLAQSQIPETDHLHLHA
ncbi:MAG: LysR family transcriptional regulator [Acidimicrobiales bacterium]